MEYSEYGTYCRLCGATAAYRFTKGRNDYCDMCTPPSIGTGPVSAKRRTGNPSKKHVRPRGKQKYASIAKRWYAK